MEIPENNLPENPDSTEATNAQTVTNGPAPENSIAEKIRSAVKGAFVRASDKINSKRGRGRPKNCPNCGNPETKCICTAEDKAGIFPENTSGAGGSADFSAELVTKAIAAVVKSGCGAANSVIRQKAMEKTGDKAFAVALVAECNPTEDELQSLGELAHICLRKYGVGMEYAPEIGLGCIVIGIGARYAMAFKNVADMPNKVVEGK